MTEETKKSPDNKTKRERSTAYPAISLKEAIDLSGKLINAYSKSPFSRELAVQAIGYNSVTGTSAPKVAALVHYGLLERSGSAYKNSDLASRITDFVSEEDKKEALIKALVNPKLFASLINEYSGKAIPGLLKNILVSQYKIGRKVADDVANTFKESSEFAGIYINGVIAEISIDSSDGKDQVKVNEPKSPRQHIGVSDARKETGIHHGSSSMQSVTLPSGIVISYPTDIAYLFAIGKFGKEISELDEAVMKAKPKDENHGKNDTTPAE